MNGFNGVMRPKSRAYAPNVNHRTGMCLERISQNPCLKINARATLLQAWMFLFSTDLPEGRENSIIGLIEIVPKLRSSYVHNRLT